MKNLVFILFLFILNVKVLSQPNMVFVLKEDGKKKLVVEDKDFMIKGMNWDYIPIGSNPVDVDFWNKPDKLIKSALNNEMALLRSMNVNAIRQYTGVPARWIKYIYQNYGIYTMLNHSFGRYGISINGVWIPVTNYNEPEVQEFLLEEIRHLVSEYKDTPGLLLYLLGNENNYGLFWAGNETEDFPDDKGKINFIGETRGRPMYRLMNEAAKIIKQMDQSHPVAICNGDVLFIDIVADECKDVDIYGVNSYRGASFTDLFQVVKEKLDMPVMFTEFGADAYNSVEKREDQISQAYYLCENWKEIYCNAADLGGADNSIGGFTFQFSDGWWKYGFDHRENAEVHDNTASWANGGYSDFSEGENNMNEEWFGICAKGPINELGIYDLFPRKAYFVLKEIHLLDPYENHVTQDYVSNYFKDIEFKNNLNLDN